MVDAGFGVAGFALPLLDAAGFGLAAAAGFGVAGFGLAGFGVDGLAAAGFGLAADIRLAAGFGVDGFGVDDFGVDGFGVAGFARPLAARDVHPVRAAVCPRPHGLPAMEPLSPALIISLLTSVILSSWLIQRWATHDAFIGYMIPGLRPGTRSIAFLFQVA